MTNEPETELDLEMSQCSKRTSPLLFRLLLVILLASWFVG